MAVTVAASSLKEALELLAPFIAECCGCGDGLCCIGDECGFWDSEGQTTGSGSLTVASDTSIGCSPCEIPAGTYPSEDFFTTLQSDCIVNSAGGFTLGDCVYEFDLFFYKDCPPATEGTSGDLLMDLSVRVQQYDGITLICSDFIDQTGIAASLICNGDGTMTMTGTYGAFTGTATIGWV